MARESPLSKAASVRVIRFLRVLLVSGGVPWLPRILALGGVIGFVAYLNCPYQLIPESVPIFGYADDVSILLLGLLGAWFTMPSGLLENGRARASIVPARLIAAEPPDSAERDRYFIITAGRSGSTLLSAILADAGADFGMRVPESWDETGGAFENPNMWRAAACYRRAYRIAPDRPPWPQNWAWAAHRHCGNGHLRKALGRARFFKAIHIDLAVQAAFKAGYSPRIIVSYRGFFEQMVSLSKTFSERGVDAHEAEYLRTYRNALLWLHLYGGCVVSYEELIDIHSNNWIASLAHTTELSADAIAKARAARLKLDVMPIRRTKPSLSRAIAEIEATFQALQGCVVPASHVALRARRNPKRVALPAPGSTRSVIRADLSAAALRRDRLSPDSTR